MVMIDPTLWGRRPGIGQLTLLMDHVMAAMRAVVADNDANLDTAIDNIREAAWDLDAGEGDGVSQALIEVSEQVGGIRRGTPGAIASSIIIASRERGS